MIFIVIFISESRSTIKSNKYGTKKEGEEVWQTFQDDRGGEIGIRGTEEPRRGGTEKEKGGYADTVFKGVKI